jgi:hypothetical protein
MVIVRHSDHHLFMIGVAIVRIDPTGPRHGVAVEGVLGSGSNLLGLGMI